MSPVKGLRKSQDLNCFPLARNSAFMLSTGNWARMTDLCNLSEYLLPSLSLDLEKNVRYLHLQLNYFFFLAQSESQLILCLHSISFQTLKFKYLVHEFKSIFNYHYTDKEFVMVYMHLVQHCLHETIRTMQRRREKNCSWQM